jgi:hypothetical protein
VKWQADFVAKSYQRSENQVLELIEFGEGKDAGFQPSLE